MTDRADISEYASSWVVRRGVVDEITIDVRKFAWNADEIRRRAPALRWVRFTGLTHLDDTERGDDSSEWLEMRGRLEEALTKGDVRYFSAEDARAEWPNRDFEGSGLYVRSHAHAIATWIASQPELAAKLRGLGLNGIEPTTLRALAGLADLEELEIAGELGPAIDTKLQPLRLRVRSKDPAAVRALLESPFGARIVDLDLEHAESVLETSCAPRLRSLRISEAVDLEALAKTSSLGNLEHLDLDGRTYPMAFAPVLMSDRFPSLRTLRLNTTLDMSDVRAFIARGFGDRPLSKQLEELEVHGDGLEGHAAELAWFLRGHLRF